MKEGFYWIQHNGVVQVAYYRHGTTDDLETGQTIHGVWHLTQGDALCDNGEAEILAAPFLPLFSECMAFPPSGTSLQAIR